MSKNGVAYLIHPHRFLTADYGKGLKTFIDKKRGINTLICFGVDQAFEAATTYTGIFGYSANNKYFRFKNTTTENFRSQEFNIRQFDSSGSHWTLANHSNSTDIIAKLKNYELKLKDIFDGIYQGIVTVGDKIFILHGRIENDYFHGYSEALERTIRIEANVMRPLLKGEHIRRYAQPNSDLWVFYPHYQSISSKTFSYTEQALRVDFPMAYNYISNFRDELIEKKIKYKTNPQFWFSLHRSREINIFQQQQKILTPQLQNFPHFTLDNEQWYPDAGGYSLVKNMKVI